MARGARVVEIGCGPHGCLELLSERVGPSGSVVGIERSVDAVALARKLVLERGLGNVEVLEGDARSTGLPRASFDLATARLVLVNVPQPEQIVAEAAALVRPGGWVAFHEADYVSHICDPPLDAWTNLVGLLETYSEKNGIDPFIGRKLPRLLRDAGLTEVRVNPIIHIYPPGHGRRNILLDFAENLSERILAQGLVGERELTEMKVTLGKHLANPDTLVVSHLFFQVWGRKAK
jgi:SAM-dependent methyltransferase